MNDRRVYRRDAGRDGQREQQAASVREAALAGALVASSGWGIVLLMATWLGII